ncbi:MAG: Gfo/Idh/MocA family oxidoreductase [Opitutales bacterium]
MKKTTNVSRRRFLGSAIAAMGIAGVAPSLIPSSALGRDGRNAASDRITLGFIGIGTQGRGHLNTFLNNPEVQVLAVCDVDSERREHSHKMVEDRYARQNGAGSYSGCAAYNDFRELLARDDIDAVVIATPDHWHAIPSIMAARAGKDVFCEKPLTLTVREGQEMREAVRRYGRVFQTGSQQRSSGNFRTACELVRSGYIGELIRVNAAVGGTATDDYLPGETPPEGLDWNLWLGPAPWRPYNEILSPRGVHSHFPNWRHYKDYSGGAMTDWGAHHFDIAQWGMGMDGSGPVEILPPNGEDVTELTYRYANGVTLHKGGGNGVLFQGTEGEIEVNRGHLRTTPDSLMRQRLKPSDVHLYNSPGHHADWLQCIRTRRRPICDVEIGASTINVCHLGNIALWLDRPIKWDPEKEEIVGDPEAARWLDRSSREPWGLLS